jgi:rfaE bifunctional protein nucleotidyltransferase chain/domain/rfaE bifunctional protein kinase chain/domain
MTAATWLDEHVREVGDALDTLRTQAPRLDRWAATLRAVLGSGGRVLVAGNGGSAAQAQHLTAELVGRFREDRAPYSAIALTADTATLTAVVNDYGADEVFARQVQGHGRPGDVLVLLSTSGTSPNVLRAAERGHELGLTVWAVTGPAPNPLARLADDAVCVEAPTTASVQAGHLVALHALCAAFDALLREPATPVTPATSATPAEWRVRPDSPGRVGPNSPLGDGGPGDAGHGDAGHDPRAGAHRRPRVVVVGDLLLDRDVDGTTERLCPDSVAPVLDVAAVRESPGGAGLAALLCAASGADVTLVAPVADDDAGRRLRELLRAGDVHLVPLPHVGGTRTKTRVRSAGQSLVRIDDGGPGEPGDLDVGIVRAAVDGADAVLVSDYGAGVTRDARVRAVLAEALPQTRTVWDPHPRGGDPLPGVVLVTPNVAEARRALGGGGQVPPDLLATSLRDVWRARGVVVTAGALGAYLAGAGDPVFVPAVPARGGDPCGAGDRFAASAVVALARGHLPSRAVEAAVADASAWVAGGGAEGYRRRRAEPAPAPAPEAGPRDEPGDPVGSLAARLRLTGGTLVATGGCFDLVHAGHVATLQAARRLGDALVVLMNSDASVRRLKGPDRPVVGAADRARVLEALDCVDAVVVFDEDDPRAVLDRLRPEVWAKGGDYGGTRLPEADVVEQHGGRVVLLPYLDGRSTTSILRRSVATTGSVGATPAARDPRPSRDPVPARSSKEPS